MNTPNVSEIAQALRGSDFPSRFSADESRLLIKVLRLVAEGRPVTPGQVEQAATHLELPLGAATSFLKKLSESDAAGNIVGLLGLSQNSHSHRFEVNGQILSTWCAWDTLFLPAVLGQTAEVESSCRATKEKIWLRITPETVEDVVPPSSVVSIVIPEVTSTNLDAMEGIWMTFCRLVHFFSSNETASQWLSENREDLRIISVADGYQLGRMAFQDLLHYV